MSETEMPHGTQAARGCPIARAATAWLLPFAMIFCPGPVGAQPGELPGARVAWVRGEHAYIAAADSLALTPGARVSFVMRRKTLASGEVERIVDAGMAIVRVTSGSLAKARHLERIRVRAEPATGPRLVRIGVPSEWRGPPLFACESLTVAQPADGGAWRVEGARPEFHMIRGPAVTSWPETVVVRLFADEADQEIALERGDLDVGVFWPGELSARMRGDPRWKERLAAPLGRGLVATIPGAGVVSSCAVARATAEAFQALSRNVFRGDLQVANGRAATCPNTAGAIARVHYDLELECPGRATLDRYLNRDLSSSAPEAVVHVSCIDPRTFAAEDVVSAVGFVQVVCAPRFALPVKALGAGALVELLDCLPPGREP